MFASNRRSSSTTAPIRSNNTGFLSTLLGNILRRSGAWSLGTRLGSYVTTQTFNAQGRLATQLDARNGTAGASNRVTEYQYDASGNTRFEATKAASADPTTVQERASFYGADDRLIGVDLRSPGRRMLEEYRYDALGRRVWASRDQMCAPTSDLSCVTDGPTRTVWDGTDEVAEIRAPLGATNGAELNGGFPLLPHAGVGDPNPFYGRVVYGPSLTIDEPVSVTRYEYRDNPSGGTSAMWPTFTLMPFWDYRGTPVYGVTTDGATAIPLNPGGTSCPNPGVATSTRCALVSWNFAWDAYRQETGGYLTLSWHGNVLTGKTDGSGLQYMRNRVYNPGSGRFTQEDPIGLAGGLNLYGYANGDPVNFSDPFGLCPKKVTGRECDLKDVVVVSASLGFKASVGVRVAGPFSVNLEAQIGPDYKATYTGHGLVGRSATDGVALQAKGLGMSGGPSSVRETWSEGSQPKTFGKSGVNAIPGAFLDERLARASLQAILGLDVGVNIDALKEIGNRLFDQAPQKLGPLPPR